MDFLPFSEFFLKMFVLFVLFLVVIAFKGTNPKDWLNWYTDLSYKRFELQNKIEVMFEWIVLKNGTIVWHTQRHTIATCWCTMDSTTITNQCRRQWCWLCRTPRATTPASRSCSPVIRWAALTVCLPHWTCLIASICLWPCTLYLFVLSVVCWIVFHHCESWPKGIPVSYTHLTLPTICSV